MLVCFRCSAQTKENLDLLVASGAYRDYEDVVAAAVANLVLMEKEFGRTGKLTVQASDAELISPPVREPPATSHEKRWSSANGDGRHQDEPAVVAPRNDDGEIQTRSKRRPRPQVPVIFRRESLPETAPPGLADLPSDMWRNGQDVPLDRWILGQFNRLLPVKANARALLNLFMAEEDALSIEDAARRVADEALMLSKYLVTLVRLSQFLLAARVGGNGILYG